MNQPPVALRIHRGPDAAEALAPAAIRPLTLMLLLATFLIDLAAVTNRDDLSPRILWTFHGLLVGQGLALGAWMTLGEMHRLWRATLCLLAAAALAWCVALMQYASLADVTVLAWGRVFGSFALIAVGAALSAAIFLVIHLRWPGNDSSAARQPLRYPVVELLGWMAVVAIASMAARHAQIAHLVSSRGELALLVLCIATSALAAVQLRPQAHNRMAVRAAACCLTFLACRAAAPMLAPMVDNQSQWVVGTALIYMVAWIAVRRLDAAPSGLKSA